MHQQLNPVLKAVSDAVLAVASNLSVDEVLQRLVDSARELAGARYAALGIPDGEGGFRRFLVSGMTDELIARMGPLPRTHGVLGAILEEPGPYRTEDIQADARFRGWWPRGHPDMHSMLGVPIVSVEGTIGAFYLTEKEGADAFDAEDQELIEVLAAHAAIAITNARLYERSRELSIVSERNRLALELDGLEETLRKEVAMLGRVHGMDIDLRIDGRFESSAEHHSELAILRIAHEALHNALRHAGADHIIVHLAATGDGALTVEVIDDGIGFDPSSADLRSRHLGLTSMEERVRELGGCLTIDSHPGEGTTVRLRLQAHG